MKFWRSLGVRSLPPGAVSGPVSTDCHFSSPFQCSSGLFPNLGKVIALWCPLVGLQMWGGTNLQARSHLHVLELALS